MAGVAADLSHINTPTKISAFTGPDELGDCLKGCEVVVIPAGVPRKPGMTRDDLFNINAGIVRGLAEAAAEHCPKAQLHIISNPVNSTVPIAVEVFKAKGVYDKRKIMGVTRLDVVRSNTFVAESAGLSVKDVSVPCVGGHAGTTILPLLSQASPAEAAAGWDDAAAAAEMTGKVQEAGTEVVKAKDGKGSATLSMAYAAAGFLQSALRGLDGEQGVVECAYVETDLIDELQFFAARCVLGKEGVEEVLPLQVGDKPLTTYELNAIQELIPVLQGNVKKGVEFARGVASAN